MSALKTLVVLLAVALIGSQAAPTETSCEDRNRTVSQDHLHKVNGHWVLVWAASHGSSSEELLTNLTSSHVVFTLTEDNTTMIFHEKNLHGDVCNTYSTNLTVTSEEEGYKISTNRAVAEKNGVVQIYNDTEELQIFESCDECLTLLFTWDGNKGLLAYRKEGHHLNTEEAKGFHSDYEQLAECLSIPLGNRFTYDGAADFCHKKSSPEKSDQVTLEEPAVNLELSQ